MPTEDAALMGSILVDSDMRGIFSHGTQMAPAYIDKLLDGSINPRPNIRFIREAGSIRVLDGDGGLGHLACRRGTEWAVDEAKRTGLAAVTTRNHHHVGAAGSYARMAVERDCIGMVISSRRIGLDRNMSVRAAHPSSPISIAVPANREPALVMDQGVWLPWDERFFEQHPFVYFKDLALGSVLQAMGGILAGIYQSELQPAESRWPSDQGAFVAVFSIESFMPVDEFKREMDRFIRQAGRMQPFPGFAAADLAGGPESRHFREFETNGIPIGSDHQTVLCELGARLGVATPFAEFAHTQFTTGHGKPRRILLGMGKRIAQSAKKRLFK